MADQWFDLERNHFGLDLHKCSTAEARAILESRIEECFRYGVVTLEVIFGTPTLKKPGAAYASGGMKGGIELFRLLFELRAGLEDRVAHGLLGRDVRDQPHPPRPRTEIPAAFR